jgi:hypothetical protein
MVKLSEMAKDYVSPKTKNIADLEKVSVDIELKDESFLDKDKKTVNIKVAEIDGESYRVPLSVVKQLQTLMKEIPDLKFIKVVAKGTGINTDYQVIPLK